MTQSENRAPGESRPTIVEERSRKRVHDGHLKVDQITLAHELFAGGMSPDTVREVAQPGDAVAALLFDVDRQEVVLVHQFRVGPMLKRSGDGWILETTAGMVREGEDPKQALFRTVQDETKYRVSQATKIATFFSSPGLSSEVIFLFYAEVRRTDQVGDGGGRSREGEDIRLARIGLDPFFLMLANREFEDPKLIIAGYWFKERNARKELGFDNRQSKTYDFRLKARPNRTVGYKTGNILLTSDVDVWVNNENTDMMMDRFYGRSISAAIRYAGAEKFEGSDRVKSDVIADALRAVMRGRAFVRPATVLDTPAGALELTHNVRRIFHVAAVEGQIGQGIKPNLEMLEKCIDEVLRAIDAASSRLWPYKSVLIPMLGTGEGGFSVNDVAPRLVDRALAYLNGTPHSRLESVYFVAFTYGDVQVLENVMSGSPLLQKAG